MEKNRGSKNGSTVHLSGDITEVRCPVCDYFLCEALEVVGVAIIKMVCRSCRNRVILKLTTPQIFVEQV